MTQVVVCTAIDEIESIPKDMLPMLVLSGNNMSFLNWAIEKRTQSHYAHLMWLHRPGFFATQDWWYREVPIKNYQNSRLKLWRGINWTAQDRKNILSRIYLELNKPKWKTRYDLLAILGQLMGKANIHVPWTNICSDWANLLKISDDRYDLYNPDPGDVNRWLEEHDGYECYTRFIPD